MKDPEDNKFRIIVPYHTTNSILQDTHDNVLSLFAVVCVIIIIYLLYDGKWGKMEIIIQVATIFA